MSLFPNGHHSGMFVRASVDAVANCLVKWGNEELVSRFTTAEPKRMSLEEAWHHVEMRDFQPDRGFLITVSGGWSAFFDNHRDEYLAQAELYVISERLKTETCFFFLDDRPESIYRGTAHFSFDWFVGGDVPVGQRQVLLLKEDSWSLQQSGTPLPFEETDAYRVPDYREQVKSELLRSYGAALGIPFWDPEAYGRDVYLLRWNTGPTTSAQKVRSILTALWREVISEERKREHR